MFNVASRVKKLDQKVYFNFKDHLELITDLYKAQSKSVFQTYWPILFYLSKKAGLKKLFFNIKLSQGFVKQLGSETNDQLYKICKKIGLAFSLNITKYTPFTSKGTKKLNLIFFRNLDLQAV